MNYFDDDFSELQDVAILYWHVFSNIGYFVRNNLAARSTFQVIIAGRVVSMTMSVNYVIEFQFLVFDELH